jgi:predicted GNAT family acetyltransferase
LRSPSSNAIRIEHIGGAALPAALAYLDRRPILNVFLTHVLSGDFSATFHKNVLVANDEGRIAGVAYCGRHICIAAESQAIPSLAQHLATSCPVRMIIGERSVVNALWPLVATRLSAPRLVRERQLVMSVSRSTLRETNGPVDVRRATMSEARAVAESSASMIAHELEYDPRRERGSFDAGVRQMIERKLWWVGISSGRLCFFCNIGPWSEHTAQLQGIWTPPDLRGRGLATAALGAICNRLLEVFPTLSLYVNDFNDRAIALYRRTGFETVGEFKTIVF